jgi:hypothetical protein
VSATARQATNGGVSARRTRLTVADDPDGKTAEITSIDAEKRDSRIGHAGCSRALACRHTESPIAETGRRERTTTYADDYHS